MVAIEAGSDPFLRTCPNCGDTAGLDKDARGYIFRCHNLKCSCGTPDPYPSALEALEAWDQGKVLTPYYKEQKND